MAAVKRIGLLVAAAALLGAGYAGWYVFGSWPVPAGYSFPRHSIWGGGPTALFEGSLQNLDGCIRTAGQQPFTVVWPPGYRLTLEDDEPVVLGGSKGLRMGAPIRMGGGYYETGDPPPTARDLGSCPPPYFLSTGFVD